MNDNVVGQDRSILIPQSFNEHPLVTVPFDGDLLMVLAQLGEALGYADHGLTKQLGRWESRGLVREGVHFRKLSNGELARFKEVLEVYFANCEVVPPKARHLTVITERGLYRLLTLIPDKAVAIAFQDWLEGDVLPQLRRTGSYTAPTAAPTPKKTRRRNPKPDQLAQLVMTLDQFEHDGFIPSSAATALRDLVERLGKPQRRQRRIATSAPGAAILSVTLMEAWTERAVRALDEGRKPDRRMTIHDHLHGRARLLLRSIRGLARAQVLEVIAEEWIQTFGLPTPFPGETSERAPFGRALALVDRMNAEQLARALPMAAARREQCVLIDFTGLVGRGWRPYPPKPEVDPVAEELAGLRKAVQALNPAE